jgi:hypothetical protein
MRLARPRPASLKGPPHWKSLERRLLKLAERGDLGGALQELRRFAESRCGAKTRRGTTCKRKGLAKGRGPNHGGMSTGPRTPEGRRRALANLRQYRGVLRQY